MLSYSEQADIYYKDHKEYKKAKSAGIAMDNALKMVDSKGGVTNTHFMMGNYLKYFSYERLPQNRN